MYIKKTTIYTQAIRKHKFVHILDDPGSADLSAYVDFAAIKHSAKEASGLHSSMNSYCLFVLFMARQAFLTRLVLLSMQMIFLSMDQ